MLCLCCSCCKGASRSGLTKLIRENGRESAIVLETLEGMKGQWRVFENGDIELKLLCSNWKYVALVDETIVGLEFETEAEARKGTEQLNANSCSFFCKGKYSFPARLPYFVLFYGWDSIIQEQDGAMWIEENSEKILLWVGESADKDEVLTIDGYIGVATFAIFGSDLKTFKSIVIGESVKVLYWAC